MPFDFSRDRKLITTPVPGSNETRIENVAKISKHNYISLNKMTSERRHKVEATCTDYENKSNGQSRSGPQRFSVFHHKNNLGLIFFILKS